jgi:hypothetical protein
MDNPSTKRFVSSLSNVSINTAPSSSYFIYKEYCIVNRVVYKRVLKDSKEHWEVIETVKPEEIFKLAGYSLHIIKKRPRVNYFKIIQDEFDKIKDNDLLHVDNIKITSDNESDIKEKKLVEIYTKCFTGGKEKKLTTFYDLGTICTNFGEEFCQKKIYKELFSKQYLTSNQARIKKSEIQKNIKGSIRFIKFANKLPVGVYQNANIHITDFVKIKKDDWNDFLCGKKKKDEEEDDDDDDEIENGK